MEAPDLGLELIEDWSENLVPHLMFARLNLVGILIALDWIYFSLPCLARQSFWFLCWYWVPSADAAKSTVPRVSTPFGSRWASWDGISLHCRTESRDNKHVPLCSAVIPHVHSIPFVQTNAYWFCYPVIYWFDVQSFSSLFLWVTQVESSVLLYVQLDLQNYLDMLQTLDCIVWTHF